MPYRGGLLADLAPQLERGVERFARDATQDVGKFMRRQVRRHTPVAKADAAILASYGSVAAWTAARGRAPGTLRESWQLGDVDVIRAGGRIYRIDVFTFDPIAAHVEWPTIAHPIRSKPGHVLTIPTRLGMAFATEVMHPGTQGSFMLATTMLETAAGWQSIVAKRWAAESRNRRFWRETP